MTKQTTNQNKINENKFLPERKEMKNKNQEMGMIIIKYVKVYTVQSPILLTFYKHDQLPVIINRLLTTELKYTVYNKNKSFVVFILFFWDFEAFLSQFITM